MVPRKPWAYGLATSSVIVFVLGFVLAFIPPNPDCGGELEFYCLEAAYDERVSQVLTLWVAATVLLLAAMALYYYLHRNPPALPQKRAKAPKKDPLATVTHTKDGRRVHSARMPPDPDNREKW